MSNDLMKNKPRPTFQQLLEMDAVKKRFAEILDKNAGGFIQSLLTIYNSNETLRKCDPYSILAAAGLAATLNLSLAPSLGHAYIIPYGNKAQFQIGWKGLVQLAHRTGKYVTLNSSVVYEGQIREVDFVTGAIIKGEKISDEIVGYVAYMELSNGFHKSLYMTKAEVEEHAQKFSQTYQADKQRKWSTWAKFFDSMAKKTVLKLLLSRWGILSADLATAIQADQALVDKTSYTYVDNDGKTVTRENFIDMEDYSSEPQFDAVNLETGEVLPEENSEG